MNQMSTADTVRDASARLSRFQSVDGTSKVGLTVDDSTMASLGG